MDPLRTLKTFRAQYPTPMTDVQRGALLNAVAWALGGGWGLLDKPSGAHVPQPKTGRLVAGDILFDKTSGHHYDVLRDGEGAAEPEWQDDGVMDVSRWVAPVAPDAPTPAPPPAKPPKSNEPSLSDLVQALAAMEDQIAEILLTVKMIGNTPAPIYRTTIDPFNIPVVLRPDPPQEAQS